MAYSTKWGIHSMRRETADGYVMYVQVTLTGIDSDDPSKTAIVGEQCNFPRPADGNLIPYENLTEDIVLGWVKEKWAKDILHGMPMTQHMETRLNAFMNLPKMADGMPWNSNLETTRAGISTTETP